MLRVAKVLMKGKREGRTSVAARKPVSRVLRKGDGNEEEDADEENRW